MNSKLREAGPVGVFPPDGHPLVRASIRVKTVGSFRETRESDSRTECSHMGLMPWEGGSRAGLTQVFR